MVVVVGLGPEKVGKARRRLLGGRARVTRPMVYTPALPNITHATPMTGACSPSFGAVGVLPSLGRSLALPFCSLADQSAA